MRFRPDGPDIPDELVALQEKGDTIFICGAGVSRMVGLPSLSGPPKKRLPRPWRRLAATSGRRGGHGGWRPPRQSIRPSASNSRAASSSFGIFLSSTECGERIRTAVRGALISPDEADLSGHLALLKLSRDQEGQSRIVTTNFDTLFERSWLEKHGWAVASHANSAMPQPKATGFRGVLHLHGRLADDRPGVDLPETDLVLTSAEFGDAYLRSGSGVALRL